MNFQNLLNEAVDILEGFSVPDADIDARILLEEAFALDEARFLFFKHKDIESVDDYSKKLETFRRYINERSKRIPLQHILGYSTFYGRRFYVNSDVLIPRQDTEFLVYEIVNDFKNGKKLKVLDMCTGSGAIAISLALELKYANLYAADLSEEALKVAYKNAVNILEGYDIIKGCKDESIIRDNELRKHFHLFKSDIYSSVMDFIKDEKFDIIVSNPPYIRTEDLKTLDIEVRDHDPMMALDGKMDGLYFYREIINGAGDFLKKGGSIYFETGYDQGKDIEKLLQNKGFKDIKIIKDFNLNDRVIKAIYA